MERARREFGDVFTVRLAQVGTFVFVADPSELRRIFTAPGDRLAAGVSNRRLEPLLGPRSVLLLDGDEHLRHRRLLLPPFHGERLAAYASLIGRIAREHAAGWPRGESVPLRPRFAAITLEVILSAVLGLGPSPRRDELREAIVALLASAQGPMALIPWLRRDLGPRSPWRRFLRARARVDALLLAEIARRRRAADLPAREDVLSGLLLVRDDAGEGFSDGELRDQLMTLLVAGHETTATALAWAVERLARTPAALERARSGDDAYLDAVVRETLRRRPPLPLVGRFVLEEPWTLRGWAVPVGAMLAPCVWLVHHRADLYPDPYAFRPERFLEGAVDAYGWLPFGGGSRRCLGASFALLEMREVLRAVLGRVASAPDDPPELAGRRAIVLAPRAGARVRLSPPTTAPSAAGRAG
jgi:cytochrome P450